jgi:ATP-binding cassette subfamily C (CFTR/MRP) protein 1
MAMLVSVLGPVPAAVALGVTLAIVPASTAVGRRLAALRRGVIAKTDARVKLAAEVVGGIRAVKLGAWEGPYVDRITALRNEELR